MARNARIGWRLGVLGLVAVVTALSWHHASIARQTLVLRSDPESLLGDPALRAIVLADGRKVFALHCAACHGTAGQGDTARAMPNLTDKDFLFGRGQVGEIEQIVLHGIRAGDTKGANLAEMPGFAKAVPSERETLPALTPAQIRDLTVFLRAANGHGGYDLEQIARGRALFTSAGACWDCHGSNGGGDSAIGAPDLIDGLWLKGTGSEADIAYTIRSGLAGVSPAFQRHLSAYDARVVAAYAASLHQPLARATP